MLCNKDYYPHLKSENVPNAASLTKILGERLRAPTDAVEDVEEGAQSQVRLLLPLLLVRVAFLANSVKVGDCGDHVLQHVRHRSRHLVVVKAHVHADLLQRQISVDHPRLQHTHFTSVNASFQLSLFVNNILEGCCLCRDRPEHEWR